MNGGALGIVDWGVGGLGFYRELRRRRPDAAIVYWSDTGATPYGKLSRRALADRVAAVLAQLAELGAGCAVVACNAASTVLDDVDSEIPVAGMIEPAVESVLRWRETTGGGRVGVVGGARTIRSQIYRRRLEAAGLEVVQRVAQPLSALIEAGELAGPRLDAELASILGPIKRVDALLLACTHYPAISSRFRAHLPGVALLDPVDTLAFQVIDAWDLARDGTEPRFLTTGDPAAMQRAARAAFDVDLASVSRAKL